MDFFYAGNGESPSGPPTAQTGGEADQPAEGGGVDPAVVAVKHRNPPPISNRMQSLNSRFI